MIKSTLSNSGNALGSLLLFLAVMAVMAILLEAVTRMIIGAPMKERLPLSRVMPDPDTGWVLYPSDEHYTYEHYVKLNAMGFRDDEINGKQPGEYRILAVGDSHIYGQGLGNDELLTTYLEEDLNSTGSPCRFNIINMGIRAYSTNSELALLGKTARTLEPEHIIVYFYLNDFIPVNIAHRYSRFSCMDWYTFDFSDKPTDEHVRKWRLVQLARSSAFLMWLHDTYRRLAGESDPSNRILQDDIDQATQEMIDGTIEALDGIRLLSEDLGIRFTLALIPVSSQLVTDFHARGYQPILEQYANRTGVDYLDLLPDLRMHHEQHSDTLVIPFDGHYNGQAHRVMALSTSRHLDAAHLCPE